MASLAACPRNLCRNPSRRLRPIYLGLAAEHWLSRFSWVALIVAVVIGIAMTFLLRERTELGLRRCAQSRLQITDRARVLARAEIVAMSVDTHSCRRRKPHWRVHANWVIRCVYVDS